MFALFEAGFQIIRSHSQPHVSAAPHVGLTVWHLSEVLTGHVNKDFHNLYFSSISANFPSSSPGTLAPFNGIVFRKFKKD